MSGRWKWAVMVVLFLLAAALTSLVVVVEKESAANAAQQTRQLDVNTQAIEALRRDAAARDRQADAQQRSSTLFVQSFLRAQAAECHAALDADRKLGAVIPAAPDPCVVVLATPRAAP